MKSPAEHELGPLKPLQSAPNLIDFPQEAYIPVNHAQKIFCIFVFGDS
jgi:hypothetical protein